MSNSDPSQRANSAALRYLSHRPRSEAEVRSRLRRRFDAAVVENVVTSLKEQALVDDAGFARLWKEGRNSLKPRSAWAIKRELESKGIDRAIAEEAVRDVDDEESAQRAGRRQAARLEQADLATFRRKLWGYLRRRGYSDSVCRRTINKLWEEMDF